jgi:hypothetical protein
MVDCYAFDFASIRLYLYSNRKIEAYLLTSNTLKGIKLPGTNSDLTVPIGGQTYEGSNTPIIYDGIDWTVRGNTVHPETGIVIFLDVLGMKGIWKILPVNRVIQTWNQVIRAFMDSLERRPPRGGHLFRVLSDTIIITFPAPLKDSVIREAFDLLLWPFIESLKLRMLIRGTISYGNYFLSERLILGEALDDAAEIHNNINWIGISISPSLSAFPNLHSITGESFFFHRSAPQKKGPYDGLVLNWPKFDHDKSCYTILEEERQKSNDTVKYVNTFRFYHNVVGQRAKIKD